MGVTSKTGLSSVQEEVQEDKIQTAAFVNSNRNTIRTIDTGTDTTRNTSTYVDSDLQNFFSRPILVDTITWAPGTDIDQTYDPWQVFLGDSAVRAKIANYHLMRMKLHVRFVINGSPFYYGRAIMTYAPLTGMKNTAAITNVGLEQLSYRMMITQLPKVYIDPTVSASGQLDIPFFFPDNYINLDDYTGQFDTSSLGKLSITSLNPLQFANTGVATDLSISLYVWASDVELCVPTSFSSVVPQMNDGTMKVRRKSNMHSIEYQPKGILSSAAASVASIAGRLKDAPIIGPYAKATEIGATLAGGVASFFGFSRPAFIEAPVLYKPLANSSIANTIGLDTVSKLTFDPKQETTVSTSIAGLDDADHMNFSAITSREALIEQFDWNINQVPDSSLFDVVVTPTYGRLTNPIDFTLTKLSMTPMAWITMPFKYWSGTINYRIQIVASAYHRGRLKVTYEPYGAANAPTEYNTAYTHIIDLDDCRDYEFSVSWAQATAYCTLADVREDYTSVPITPFNVGKYNGKIYVSVVNQLSAPSNLANIQVNIYASAGEDLEVMGTIAPDMVDYDGGSEDKLTPYQTYASAAASPPALLANEEAVIPIVQPQGRDELAAENAMNRLVGQPNSSVMESKSAVFHGEVFTSIRPLLKRYDALESATFQSTLTSFQRALVKYTLYRPMYPAAGGSVRTGAGSYATLNDYNFYHTPLVVYYGSGFAGYRGGMRYKHLIIDDAFSSSIVKINRYDKTLVGSRNIRDALLLTGDTDTNTSLLVNKDFNFSGAYLGHNMTTRIHEIELPYYSNKRFLYNDMALGADDALEYGASAMNYKLVSMQTHDSIGTTNTYPNISVQRYVSTAEDFNLIWFLNAPSLYAYPITGPE